MAADAESRAADSLVFAARRRVLFNPARRRIGERPTGTSASPILQLRGWKGAHDRGRSERSELDSHFVVNSRRSRVGLLALIPQKKGKPRYATLRSIQNSASAAPSPPPSPSYCFRFAQSHLPFYFFLVSLSWISFILLLLHYTLAANSDDL